MIKQPRPGFSRRATLSGLFCLLCAVALTSTAQDVSGDSPPAELTRDEAAPLAAASDDDAADDDAAQLRASVSGYVDGLIAAIQREHSLAAVSLAIVKDNQLLTASGYGMADVAQSRPVRAEDTLFRIGSVSKTFVWTAVMMLAERGQLDLDADANQYLTAFQIRAGFNAPVTLRDLMSHRAGFEDTLQLFAVRDDDPRSLAELLAAHQPKRVFAPGTRTSYSNWGSALAAHIVEEAAGVPYGEFLRDEILLPLGMRNTTWTPPADMAPEMRQHLATGYKRDRGGLGLQGYLQLGAYWPAGGMAATATDMARWMRFHLNGGVLDDVRLLKATSHAQLWTRAFDDRPGGADVAHGFIDRPYRGLRTLGHAGGTAAFLTNMVMVPELDLGVYVSQNGAWNMAIMSVPDLVVDRLRAHPYVPLLTGDEDEAVGDVAELAGTYLNNRRVFSTFSALLGALNPSILTAVGDDGFTVNLLDSKLYQQVPGETDLYEAADGDRVAIIRDANGKAVALADGMGVHTYERLGLWTHPGTLAALLGLSLLLAITRLLGAWRRFGKGQSRGFASRFAGTVGLLSALIVFVFFAAVAYLVVSLLAFDLATMADNYPAPAMFYTHYAGWLMAIAAGAMLLSLWPAWTQANWGIFRRLHFSAFAVVLTLAALLLWQWRVIGAAVI
ncbi:MAG: class A beta-lactamase-related serine hydrolase [Gammaproteobacteria bacterium]|nr:MAG: class A beta-lactamase-related serine hydrolase [Gammaproteobacteria bacterium]